MAHADCGGFENEHSCIFRYQLLCTRHHWHVMASLRDFMVHDQIGRSLTRDHMRIPQTDLYMHYLETAFSSPTPPSTGDRVSAMAQCIYLAAATSARSPDEAWCSYKSVMRQRVFGRLLMNSTTPLAKARCEPQ